MRKIATGVLPLLLFTGGESVASSFTARPPSAVSPSIILLGEAAPSPIEALPLHGATRQAETQIYVISNSMIAMGADAIPTASEQVAAIEERAAPQKPRWLAEALPLVIRGGIVGDAQPAPVEAVAEEEAAETAPAGARQQRRQRQQRQETQGGPAPAQPAPPEPAPPIATMR